MRASFIAGVEWMKDYEVGGVRLRYAQNDHSGLGHVEPSIANRCGSFTTQ
jgi:hypothetical protein